MANTTIRQPDSVYEGMRGAIAQPYKVARAIAGAVMIDKVTFEHQKLLMPNMAMRLRRGAGGHAVVGAVVRGVPGEQGAEMRVTNSSVDGRSHGAQRVDVSDLEQVTEAKAQQAWQGRCGALDEVGSGGVPDATAVFEERGEVVVGVAAPAAAVTAAAPFRTAAAARAPEKPRALAPQEGGRIGKLLVDRATVIVGTEGVGVEAKPALQVAGMQLEQAEMPHSRTALS